MFWAIFLIYYKFSLPGIALYVKLLMFKSEHLLS